MVYLITKTLTGFVTKRKCTLLGIGPMSKNCVDATIEVANEYNIPLMLIASRRQIESSEFGGGYVSKWSTEEFSKYVSQKDKKRNVILCRDHGGPWQNDFEKESKLTLLQAMNNAKRSYETDIKSNFKIIHIDPTEDIFNSISMDEILNRIFELYKFCWSIAQNQKKEIVFEVSVGKEDGGMHSFKYIKYILSRLTIFCNKNNLPNLFFLVVRTGNYVKETRNIGHFESMINVNQNSPEKLNLLKIIQLCNKHKIMIKEHNTDYLSDRALMLHPKLGIHAANVAPEFGVVETKAFLSLLEANSLKNEMKKFIELAYSSKKWKKWMLPDSRSGKIQKAIIAGHYIFSDEEFLELKRNVEKKLSKTYNIDDHLKSQIKKTILHYVKLFNLI